jgi:hypothetical protein
MSRINRVFLVAQRHYSLFGITTLQVYIYYQYYPEDKLQNRIVVSIYHLLHEEKLKSAF